MNDAIVLIIRGYIDECLFEPSYKWYLWNKIEFDIRSYSRWAAYEILERVESSSDPIRSIKDFSDEMDYYYELVDDDLRRLMFDTARETAEEILYFMKGENGSE